VAVVQTSAPELVARCIAVKVASGCEPSLFSRMVFKSPVVLSADPPDIAPLRV
jgi:hypothetical protein